MAIEIFDNALSEVRRRMEKEHVEAAGMRVGVKGGGCSGLSYNLNFETQARTGDKVFERDGIKLFCDLKSYIYLNGTMLDALQHTTVQDVQLVRLKTEHSYLITEETKQKTNSTGKVTTPAKPATFTEKIVLTLDAKDTSATPGDQVNKYKEAIADCGYFQHALGKTNEVRLRDLGTPQPPGPDGKPFMPFTLECRYPEKTR